MTHKGWCFVKHQTNKQTSKHQFHKQHDIIFTEFGTYEKEYNSEFVFRDMNTLLHLKDSMVFWVYHKEETMAIIRFPYSSPLTDPPPTNTVTRWPLSWVRHGHTPGFYFSSILYSYIFSRRHCIDVIDASMSIGKSRFNSGIKPLMYSCFPKFLKIAIFVIIIYIPYTCLRVCCKHMLCLMYDFSLPIHERYI